MHQMPNIARDAQIHQYASIQVQAVFNDMDVIPHALIGHHAM
jgi:hypothetical protein